jgi:translation initiation factor IF-2
VKIVSAGTGDISENDVATASATRGIVIGFNVKISNSAQRVAENETVLVRTYNIIYELIEELEDVVEGMLKVGALEETLGIAQIVAEFPYGKNERIAGVRVQDGQITKGPRVKILRGEEIIGEGKIKSIKHLREEVNRLEAGDEGGFMFDTAIPFEVGDIVQSFRAL